MNLETEEGFVISRLSFLGKVNQRNFWAATAM